MVQYCAIAGIPDPDLLCYADQLSWTGFRDSFPRQDWPKFSPGPYLSVARLSPTASSVMQWLAASDSGVPDQPRPFTKHFIHPTFSLKSCSQFPGESLPHKS